MVETMLKLHKDLPKAETPHEQESIRRQIAATDKAIDAMVCELAGLTEDGVRVLWRTVRGLVLNNPGVARVPPEVPS